MENSSTTIFGYNLEKLNLTVEGTMEDIGVIMRLLDYVPGLQWNSGHKPSEYWNEFFNSTNPRILGSFSINYKNTRYDPILGDIVDDSKFVLTTGGCIKVYTELSIKSEKYVFLKIDNFIPALMQELLKTGGPWISSNIIKQTLTWIENNNNKNTEELLVDSVRMETEEFIDKYVHWDIEIIKEIIYGK